MDGIILKDKTFPALAPGKFVDPDLTARGEQRARVPLSRLDTLWINTGTLCNIACIHCYIESSPLNDRLVYISAAETAAYFDEIVALGLGTREIAFTGGEPFLNPDMMAMTEDALARGFEVLILTNAMAPIRRPRIRASLLRLKEAHGPRLKLRVSLDHYTAARHEAERGEGTFANTLAGLDWLAAEGFALAVAARTAWGEPENEARAGFARLFAARGYPIDADDSGRLVLFPEMDERRDVAEISTVCWDMLGSSPDQVMCATSRMVVKRKGAAHPVVLPCTLIAYDETFEMGATLAESFAADGGNFANGTVKLNHPHCARFCVLGGGSCSR